MPNLPTPGALRRLLIPALLLTAAMPVVAQAPAGAIVQPLPQSTDPAELLAQALRTLATEPSNLQALTAAGRNALILGDPNAAVGFFGKAQEIAPNDGHVKAGLGSALVQLEKPQDALRLFAQAGRLGVPDAEMAEDRGLAYDLTGDQARAQADYRTVLAARPDDDTARRRLALSQGISGQKTAAIATLDPLIRKRDIAAWRAQTFVLAMDGDAKGANDITRIMLPQQATMLQPFLVRLSSLSPADKARAVHFGEMPATGATYTPTQVASVSAPATYAAAPVRQTTIAPAPRSDLAPMPAKTVTQPAPAPTQVAVAAPKPVEAPRTVVATPTPAASQPAYSAAPLAQIALTPATPTPQPAVASPAPAPSLAVQVAQADPRREIAGPPSAPSDELPTPAAQGHYDLPHDAATKAPVRPAPVRPVPVPVATKTVGTPVVHGKTATASADTTAAVITKKPASADDSDISPAKARTGKASAKDADADVAPARSAKAKPADAARLAVADDDCAPVATSKGKGHSRAGVKKPATGCTKLASTDAAGTAGKGKSAGSSKAKAADADDADCAPASTSRGRGHTKAAAKKKPSTACTKLASAAAADAPVGKTKTGAKGKASTADDADDGKSSKSKSSVKTTEKGNAERVYVQVAGGANKDDLDKAWAGVKKKAPELMRGHSPSTTPLKATNRLLVGPFKDDADAQAFVNKMSAKGLSGFTFKSSKGQKVDKIDAGP